MTRYLHGKPDQLLEDAMIVATARVHLVVATRNERDLQHLDVLVHNPFKSQENS